MRPARGHYPPKENMNREQIRKKLELHGTMQGLRREALEEYISRSMPPEPEPEPGAEPVKKKTTKKKASKKKASKK